jgi:hypothetical protein
MEFGYLLIPGWRLGVISDTRFGTGCLALGAVGQQLPLRVTDSLKEESRVLLTSLLLFQVFKPERRITAELALDHPWILGQASTLFFFSNAFQAVSAHASAFCRVRAEMHCPGVVGNV